MYRNAGKEIGWFPVQFTNRETSLLADLPDELTVFHWHGDTFELPEGAVHLARTDACSHQAFLYQQRVLGLQFHLEATPETVRLMLLHGREELIEGSCIQTEDEMLILNLYSIGSNHVLHRLLNGLWKSASPSVRSPDTARQVQ